MTMGQRIAALRRGKGLSQEALGGEVGVSRQAISKWESDAAIPEIDKFIAMSKLFGVTVGALLGVEEFVVPDYSDAPPEEADAAELPADETPEAAPEQAEPEAETDPEPVEPEAGQDAEPEGEAAPDAEPEATAPEQEPEGETAQDVPESLWVILKRRGAQTVQHLKERYSVITIHMTRAKVASLVAALVVILICLFMMIFRISTQQTQIVRLNDEVSTLTTSLNRSNAKLSLMAKEMGESVNDLFWESVTARVVERTGSSAENGLTTVYIELNGAAVPDTAKIYAQSADGIRYEADSEGRAGSTYNSMFTLPTEDGYTYWLVLAENGLEIELNVDSSVKDLDTGYAYSVTVNYDGVFSAQGLDGTIKAVLEPTDWALGISTYSIDYIVYDSKDREVQSRTLETEASLPDDDGGMTISAPLTVTAEELGLEEGQSLRVKFYYWLDGHDRVGSADCEEWWEYHDGALHMLGAKPE